MLKRTNYCGLVNEDYVGREITLSGWVQNKRDMGGVIFIDLKDREGTMQVVFNAQNLSNSDFNIAETLRNQSVISVLGKISIRDEETYNPKLKTGTIELTATSIELLSVSDTPPFEIEDNTNIKEDLRLKYRFLDLRRPTMYNNLLWRHKIQTSIENYLNSENFLYVETPILTKSTPEGARDYLVPSRIHPGTFYALPQSPQIFKQLLMVSGIDKYYQIARCFRDEDLRADRQPEFTQVDIEMSFCEQEDVLVYVEKLFKHLVKETLDITLKDFPRMTWKFAMDTYGSDKPDLRFDLKIFDITNIARNCGFSVFKNAVDNGGVVRAICVPGKSDFTRTEIEDLTKKAISYGAKGMAWIALKENGELYSILTKYFKEEEMSEIIRTVGANPGDFILFSADKLPTVRRVLGSLRLDVADMLDLRQKDDFKFVIVTDFPQFEYSAEEKRFVSTHHPFTMPYVEDLPFIKTEPARVRAQAYDFVLNGIELGSGSVRIHDKDIQNQMFQALNISSEEIKKRFGFMLNAFRYGTPPHAGFAFGLDRLVMILLGLDSIRDVIAFPKIKDASCPLTNAPTSVDKSQLNVLKIAPTKN